MTRISKVQDSHGGTVTRFLGFIPPGDSWLCRWTYMIETMFKNPRVARHG